MAAGLVRFRIPFPSGGFNSARLVNADEGIPRLDLALDQSFESPRDLAFLIALTGPAVPVLPVQAPAGLAASGSYRKVLDVVPWRHPLDQAGAQHSQSPIIADVGAVIR